MKKCINSRCKFNKSTKVCHTCNFTSYYVTYSKIFCCRKPWILFWEFHGKSNLFSIDLFDQNFNFITYIEDLFRVFNSAPRHLGDMKKSIRSTKIDESTKICNIFNGTCYSIANMDFLHKFFLFLCFFSKKKLFTVTNDTSSSWIEFSDNEFDFFICIF